MSQNYKEEFTSDSINQALGSGGTVGDALKALKTFFAGPSEPPEVEPYMWWVDTSAAPSYVIKIRNVADSGWIPVFEWDGVGSPRPSGVPVAAIALALS